jgi:hypothetical protein
MRPLTSRARLKTSVPRRIRFGFISATWFAAAFAFFALAACPARAQGLASFVQRPTPRSRSARSFAALTSFGATFSVSSTAWPMYPENAANGFAFRPGTLYPAQNFGSLLPLHETKTSFVTELHVPLAELYGSRVHLGLFILTIQTGSLTLGPLATLQALHSPSQPRSINLYGIGLSVPLGKQSTPEISRNLWNVAQHLFNDR